MRHKTAVTIAPGQTSAKVTVTFGTKRKTSATHTTSSASAAQSVPTPCRRSSHSPLTCSDENHRASTTRTAATMPIASTNIAPADTIIRNENRRWRMKLRFFSTPQA
jgi:hypothetical protein